MSQFLKRMKALDKRVRPFPSARPQSDSPESSGGAEASDVVGPSPSDDIDGTSSDGDVTQPAAKPALNLNLARATPAPTSSGDTLLSPPAVSIPASPGDDVPRSKLTSASVSNMEAAGVGESASPSVSQPASPDDVNLAPLPRGESVTGRNLWITETGETFRASRVRRIVRAQDALTHHEESVYNFLWGPKVGGSGEAERIAQVGTTAIERHARIARRSVFRIMDRLQEKGFIELETPSTVTQKARYRVFNYRSVLERLRARGREYVVRTGHGVVFAAPLTAPIAGGFRPQSSGDFLAEPPWDTGSTSSGGSHASESGDSGASKGGDSRAPHIDKVLDKQKDTTTTVELREAIQVLMPMFDDHAVSRVWRQCQAQCPDVTPDEVAQLFEMKWASFRRNRAITNLAGVLINAVPTSCTRAALELLRQGREDPPPEPAPEQYTQDELEQMLNSEVASLRAIAEGELRKKYLE